MSELNLLESEAKQGQPPSGTDPSISWQDSLPIQHLLDVISSIIAEEYIVIAKRNPEVFKGIASPRQSGARNDTPADGVRNDTF